MSTKYYYFFIILFLVSSVISIGVKGYFNVRQFKAEKRPDIERFANNKLSSNSFFLVENKKLSNEILTNFNDVESVAVKKNLNMTIDLSITNKKAFGKVNDETYLSENGKIFYSKLSYDKDLPSVVVKDFSLKTEYINSDQMNFIRRLKIYPKLSIYLLSPFGFTITSESLSIEVPYNFDNTENMALVVNSEVAKRSDSHTQLVVLKDKIVFKK